MTREEKNKLALELIDAGQKLLEEVWVGQDVQMPTDSAGFSWEAYRNLRGRRAQVHAIAMDSNKPVLQVRPYRIRDKWVQGTGWTRPAFVEMKYLIPIPAGQLKEEESE